MNFTKEEMILMMLYSPGTRSGLIEELKKMREALGPREKKLARLTNETLAKLSRITDAEFDALPLCPDLGD